ncbi:MAG: hypothetical protein COB93_05290 [Sneathiella sp.]|nr:MAG: hypothetical protein COB93_05290 [Sneathiella sp.]
MSIERIFLAFLLWLVCFVMLPLQISGKSEYLDPEGPDAFMRLERVNILVETGNWHDNHIQRAGAAGGADLHWTRPMDILILAVAAPLLPFMETRDAIELAGVVFPALMSLALVFLCLWAVVPLMQQKNLLLVVIMLAVQPVIQDYVGVGRVDHHALLAVLTAAVLGCLIRLSRTGKSGNYALCAGAISGFGLWVSLEFLTIYVPVTIGLGACWLVWGQKWRKANRDFAIATLVVSVIAIVIEVPTQDWFIAWYDRISVAQAFLVLCPAIFWGAIASLCERRPTLGLRLGMAGFYGAVCLFLISQILPNLFIGPLAEADPRIGAIWYDNVSEMAPLFGKWRQVILNCLLAFAAIIYSGFVLFGQLHPERRQMSLWLIIVLIFAGALALAHIRAGLYLSVVAVIAAGPLLEDLLIWANRHFKGWRKGATGFLVRAGVILGPFLLAFAVGSIANGLKTSEAVAANTKEAPKCNVKKMAEALSAERFSGQKKLLRFVNNIDVGPEFIYRTRHHFLAVPYHRNGDSIYDTFDLLTATDYERSRALLDKYEINYILLCFNASEGIYYKKPDNISSLYSRLQAGELPDGITAVPAPAPWRLYKYKAMTP